MLSTAEIVGTLALFGASYVFWNHLKYTREVKIYNGLPGRVSFLNGRIPISSMLPKIPFLTLGKDWHWRFGHDSFANIGYDAYPVYCFFPSFKSALVVADAAMLKEITLARSRFPKPIDEYGSLTFYGNNIVTLEDQEWKRHRKVAAPAFAERMNKLVWDETLLIMHGLFDLWRSKSEIEVDHANDITMMITLMVISVAGFGNRLSWTDEDKIPEGHSMTFKNALHIVSTRMLVKLLVPSWAIGLSADWRKVRTAFLELEVYMHEMIQAGKASEPKNEERSDLLSSLIQASEQEEGAGLSDDELMGNIYIFLLAGHETSSHTLCFAMAYLALYPDIQQKLYEHIKETVADISHPTYAEMSSLTYVLAVLYETLRHIPPVMGIPKYSADDTTLRVGKVNGNNTDSLVINVPKGTRILINACGLHFNPKYWSNPLEFDPSRFLGDWPKDAFIPFSAGPRACIGRRFAETESVLILAMLVSHFKIEIIEEPQFFGETFEQKKERVLNRQQGITTTPVRVPLLFKRR